MSYPVLNAEVRTGSGKGVARKLRAEGIVPGVVYSKGQETISIQFAPKELKGVLAGDHGINTLLELNVGSDKKTVLVKEFHKHHYLDKLIHVDFLEIQPDADYTVRVPIIFSGRSVGEKAGAKKTIFRRDIFVKASAKVLPKEIVFDLSELEASTTIFVNDIPLPEGFECNTKDNYKILEIGRLMETN